MASLWGGLAGLGDGLQTVGMNISKSALAEKLEQQREARADQRQIAKEARDAEKVVGQRVVRDPDGTTWLQGINSAGENKGARTLADSQQISDFNFQEKEKENKQQKGALEVLGLERAAADYGTDKDLKNRYTEAQIAQMGDASARGWAGLDIQRQGLDVRRAGIESKLSGSSGDIATAATDYIKDNKDLLSQYTRADKEGKGALTPNELLQIVTRSIQTAAEQGKNIDQTVFGALDAYPSARKQIDLRNAQRK